MKTSLLWDDKVDTVYCVDFDRTGERFASGSADCSVIIWSAKGDPILKYTHQESIQRVVYNPTTDALASCTNSDFGLWSPTEKSVAKFKTQAKILSASWSNDGQFLALGMFSGQITIRDRKGNEKVSITREAPVWCLAWSPWKDEAFDLLAVGCWDQSLSFYHLSGIQQQKDKKLGFNPCSINYFGSGEYMLIGGSNRQALLCTREGTKLCTIAERDEWVWCVKYRPNHNCIALGDHGGGIAVMNLQFLTIHGLYKDRYAYREHMTDVIVQHLLTEQKVRIKCRDYVKKVAVFRDRLAVQLSDRIHIYDLAHHDDSYDMHYRIKERIYQNLPCNLLVVTTNHIILCQERKLQLYDYHGTMVREWVLASVIRYIKVDGGKSGSEGVLVGLKDGTVLKVYVDNAFPIELIKQSASIRCLDISVDRKQLAVVDSENRILVYDLNTKEIVFQESNANSVAFNTELGGMLSYSGSGTLAIKTGDFPVNNQKLQGFVVGFRGSKIFCLHYLQMKTIDIPQSASLCRHIEAGQFEEGYKIACLGVTDEDWKMLGLGALKSLELEVAKKAFIRIRDMRYIELVNSIESRLKSAGGDKDLLEHAKGLCQAEICAWSGDYQGAAKSYARMGEVERAINLFVDLRQWDEAKVFAAGNSSIDSKDLTRRQAEWAEDTNDWKTAAEMYLASGDTLRACRIIGDSKGKNWQTIMIDVVRNIPKSEAEVLELCGQYYADADEDGFAKEVYLKLDDFSNLMQLYIKRKNWQDATRLAEEHEGKFDKAVFLPYAEWLAVQDRFDSALDAYRKAGRPDESRRMMEELTNNAVTEGRFKDAAYYYFLLGTETLKGVKLGKDLKKNERNLALYQEYMAKADWYYAYSSIHTFCNDPFTSLQPEMLFQVSRFLINSMGNSDAPYGISRVNILYTLAKQAKVLGAFKLARFTYDRLQQLKVPESWEDNIDLDVLTIQAKPVRDNPELAPVCYRCGMTNPLLNTFGNPNNLLDGDKCTNCGHPFVRSFVNYDILPLVEFFPDGDISDEDAVEIIRTHDPKARAEGGGKKRGGNEWEEGKDGGADVMRMGDDDDDWGNGGGQGDPFERCINKVLETQEGNGAYEPVVVNAKALSSLRRDEVYVCKPVIKGMRYRFYKNMIPDISIALSQPCHRFFNEEDFEFVYLRDERCPFSRAKDVGDYGPL
ncbi:hypothetical protein TrRE_jg11942 [Triparma retinervis]|uniref:Intraflagellar transport protein 122 homolog n=1 Tax=Triparma retinervis TaxID=2557542 RepID=A0A9W7G8V9_9STRA|nr:hypothetical protein TrRE_jg11942 [Triparma retinervis]